VSWQGHVIVCGLDGVSLRIVEQLTLSGVPTVVDAGLAGHESHTARNVLGATAALMLLAGTAGLLGYRRMLNK